MNFLNSKEACHETYQAWCSDFNHITVESGFISLTVFSGVTVILANR